VIDKFVHEGVNINTIPMEIPSLGRRCVGRNIAAKATKADIVWFADADHVYREGVLDRLAEMEWPDGATMIFPKHVHIHNSHTIGDQATKLIGSTPQVVDIDPTEFSRKRQSRAIGGIQIVQGDFAREHGYLKDNSKWQGPRTDGKPFGDFIDDVAYRHFCLKLGKVVSVDLPGMYRIRHTNTTYAQRSPSF
jgi:hypothetical protein